jgi:ribosomal protein L7/L12
MNQQEKVFKKFADKFYLDPLLPYTIEMIQQAESVLGYSFPDDYKDFLIQIGAQPISPLDPEKMNELNLDENDYFCFLDSLSSLETMIQSRDNLCKELIPFGTDGNGNCLCFNKNKKGIYFWDHETGKEKFIIDSFLQLIKKISEFPTMPLPSKEEDYEEIDEEDFKYYTLFLTELGPNRLEVIKEIRKITKWPLEEIKLRIQQLPLPIMTKGKKLLLEYVAYFESLGASTSIKPS